MALVIAHRGASAYEPENSLAAFRTAAALGADGVELDVHDTAEGVFVVHHDDALDGRRIGDLDLESVREHHLPNGEPIPTLAEALEVLGTGMLVFVEVKSLDPANDTALLRILDSAPASENYHIHSFDHRIVRRLLEQRPDMTGGVLSSSYPVDPVTPVRNTGAKELWQHETLIDESLAELVHKASIELIAWTVDEPSRMEQLLRVGVDAICSNKPDLAREVVG